MDLNERGKIITREPEDTEILTSILNGYFKYNPSTPDDIIWKINLFDNISKNHKILLRKKLLEVIKQKIDRKANDNDDVDYNKLEDMLNVSFLSALRSCRSGKIKNEADFKYFLHNQFKEFVSESEINNIIFLVEYKIHQGNENIAWFSESNFQKKRHLFNKGFITEKYPAFRKIILANPEMINNESRKSFQTQMKRTFKVDLALLNITNGEVLSLIELKFKPNLTVDELESDLTKILIYNSVTEKNILGIALGYNTKSEKAMMMSNNNEFEREFTRQLNNSTANSILSRKEISSGTKPEALEKIIIKTAEESLYDEKAYGSYKYLLESSWQAEFQYRIKKYLPEGFQLRNEYTSVNFPGRIDIAILDNENNLRHLIEFKHHGEPIPKELKTKSYLNSDIINAFKEQMKKLFKEVEHNKDSKTFYEKASQDKDGRYFFNPHLTEKILDIYNQYQRLLKICAQHPIAIGYIFLNDWTTKLNVYDLKKYDLSENEYKFCFETRKKIIRELLIEEGKRSEVSFYYYNLQT